MRALVRKISSTSSAKTGKGGWAGKKAVLHVRGGRKAGERNVTDIKRTFLTMNKAWKIYEWLNFGNHKKAWGGLMGGLRYNGRSQLVGWAGRMRRQQRKSGPRKNRSKKVRNLLIWEKGLF